jgi:hypothetical protein
MTDSIAVTEMNRLKGARAWSPIATPVSKLTNQHVARYTFSDGSKLSVYLNGDAAWHSREYGEQRWRSWHYCNK